MKVKPRVFQTRKAALMKELQLLSEREEKLLVRTMIAEAVLKARHEGTKPRHPNPAQMKLRALEKKIEDWPKDPRFRAQLRMLERPELLENPEEVPSSGGERDLTRVRIGPNVVFSWSYKKIS
jgi:hypothetical protein